MGSGGTDTAWKYCRREKAGVAVGVAKRIVTKERNSRADADAAIHNELVLFEDSCTFVLVDIVRTAERPAGVIEIRSLRSVDVSNEQCVYAARIEIGQGDIRGFRELAFERDAALHGVRNLQIRVDLINRGRAYRGR